MSLKKSGDIVFILVFLAMLCGILALIVVSPKETVSYYEKRELTVKPEFSLASVADGSYFSQWESYFSDHAAGRSDLTKLAVEVNINLFHRPVVNETVITDEGLMFFQNYQQDSPEVIEESAVAMADQLEVINDTVESYGGTFLFVAIPGQYDYYADRFPSYLNNHSETTAAVKAAFFPALEERGVSYLDIGAIWDEEDESVPYMSTVDHHFTWDGAFSVYQNMMHQINRQAGLDLTVLQKEDMDIQELPQYYLGSMARKLCGCWPGTEKLRYGQLKEEIPFTRKNDDTEVPATLFAYPTTDEVTYDFFMGCDYTKTVIDTQREELPDVLIYGDSFTNALETLAYTGFNTQTSLDYRGIQELSLPDYLLLYQPEVVICVRDQGKMLRYSGNGNVLYPHDAPEE